MHRTFSPVKMYQQPAILLSSVNYLLLTPHCTSLGQGIGPSIRCPLNIAKHFDRADSFIVTDDRFVTCCVIKIENV